MGERIGRMDTDFSCHSVGIFSCHSVGIWSFLRNDKKKSVSIRPIRPIRSPIVSQSYHNCITIVSQSYHNIPKSAIHNPQSEIVLFFRESSHAGIFDNAFPIQPISKIIYISFGILMTFHIMRRVFGLLFDSAHVCGHLHWQQT
jgi:hypothetical protein